MPRGSHSRSPPRHRSRYGDDSRGNTEGGKYGRDRDRGYNDDSRRPAHVSRGDSLYGYGERERERERVRDRERYYESGRDRRDRDRAGSSRRSASPRRRSRSPSRSGSPAEDKDKDKDKGKPNFKPSGLLAAETNTVKAADGKSSTVLKYNEPPEARKPTVGWRLYVFKGSEQVGQYSFLVLVVSC